MTEGHHAQLRSRIAHLKQELAHLRQELRTSDVSAGQDAFEVLICRVGARRVAFRQSEVERVVLAAQLAELPGAPPWVAGVLNCAGDLVPVADLMAWFEQRPRLLESSDAIVICSIDERRLGLVVEEAIDLDTICGGVLRPVTNDVADIPFVLGVVPEDDGALLILSAAMVIEQLETTVA